MDALGYGKLAVNAGGDRSFVSAVGWLNSAWNITRNVEGVPNGSNNLVEAGFIVDQSLLGFALSDTGSGNTVRANGPLAVAITTSGTQNARAIQRGPGIIIRTPENTGVPRLSAITPSGSSAGNAAAAIAATPKTSTLAPKANTAAQTKKSSARVNRAGAKRSGVASRPAANTGKKG